MANQFSLLRQRRFAPFFGAQFLGAFNDNLFKTALVTVITFDALHWTTISAGLLNNLIAGLFILPFLLLSATAGQIADKFDKTRVMSVVKLMEIFIMAVAAIGMANTWAPKLSSTGSWRNSARVNSTRNAKNTPT